MKKKISLIMAFCLLISLIASVVHADEIAAPVFSLEGGIYGAAFDLTIDGRGNDIYYTTDGSEPSVISARYTKPIHVDNTKVSPRTVQGKVSQTRFDKAMVIKAICIDAFGNKSDVVTNTYFVSEVVADMAKYVPIVSLTTDPDNLWNGREGIYTNYEQDKNIPAYIEHFEDGALGFKRKIEMKIGGHYSKVNPKKSLRIYFTKGDPNEKKLEYKLIDGTDKNFYDESDVKKYGKITFRISDWNGTDLRDVVAQKVTEFMRPESANSEPTAVFLNGEFWGIYEMREQYDNRYLDFHYEGIDKDDVVFIDRDWTNDNSEYTLSDNGEKMVDRFTYDEGPEEDEEYYTDLFNYTKYLMEHASEGNNYRDLKGYMDIDNFIDYIFIYLYLDNIDWPGNNYKTWRTTAERSTGDVYGADGRWRFLVHDFDIAFDNPMNNTLEYAATGNMPDSDPRHPMFAAKTLDGMFKVEEFRNRFAQRAAAYMATAVSPENVTAIVERLLSKREAVKAYDLLRWDNMSGTTAERLNDWKQSADNTFISFARRRADVFDDFVIDFERKNYQSDISETTDFIFEIDGDLGSVDIDGAVIRKSLYGDKANSFTTKQFTNIPLTIGAETVDGYKVTSILIEENGNETVYDAQSVTITPKASVYKVKINIAPGKEDAADVSGIAILRENRFMKMKPGEKLPVDVIDESGNLIFDFDCRVEGSAVSLTNGRILTAKAAGEAKVFVTYGDITKEINVKIDE